MNAPAPRTKPARRRPLPWVAIASALVLLRFAGADTLNWVGNDGSAGNSTNGTWDDFSTISWYYPAYDFDTTWDNFPNFIDTAVFGTTGGTVTISTGEAPNLSYLSILRFEANGYTLTGGPIELDYDTTVEIRNATDTVTFNSVFAASRIQKAGEGTLVLAAANPDLGNLTVNEGVVRITNGGALGNPGSPDFNTGLTGILSPSFNAVTWTGSEFIAVGTVGYFSSYGTSDGGISVSTDGLNWSSRNPAGISQLFGVTSNGSLHVAVGSDSTLARSEDGFTWVSASLGIGNNTSDDMNAITWGGGLFVAVGNGGRVSRSPDAVFWTHGFSQGSSNELYAITSNGTIFVATGNNGTVVTSPDGGNWTVRSSGTSSTLRGVASNSTLFVAVGSGGRIITSPDSVTWSIQNSTIGTNLLAVGFHGGLFVVSGENGALLTSPDGVAWTARASGVGNHLYGVAGSGTRIVAVGSRNTGSVTTSTPVTASADGLTWTAQFMGGTLELANNITVANERVIIGGSGSNGEGALVNVSGNNTWNGQIRVASGHSLLISARNATTLTIGGSGIVGDADNRNVAFGGAGNITVNGVIGSRIDSLQKNGTGTLTLAAQNSYAQATTINEGTLRFGTNNPLPTNSSLTLSGGTILDLNNFSGTARNLQGSGNIINLNPSRTLTFNAVSSSTFSGSITGGGQLTKVGNARLTLSGSSANFTGPILVQNGSLAINGNLAAGTSAQGITVNSGAALEIAGNTTLADLVTFGGSGVSGNGAIRSTGLFPVLAGNLTLSAPALISNHGSDPSNLTITSQIDTTGGLLTLTGNASDRRIIVSGNIVGGGGFTKLSTNNLTLSGNNTTTGPVSVTAGNLILTANGSLGNASSFSFSGSSAVNVTLTNGTDNRLSDNATISFSGAALNFTPTGTGNITETLGNLIVLGGSNLLSLAWTAGQNTTLSIGGLSRTAGSLNFTGTNLGTPSSRILIGGVADGTILDPWFSFQGGAAFYTTSNGITAVSTHTGTIWTTPNGAPAAPAADDSSLLGNKTIYSLSLGNVGGGNAVDANLMGRVLTLSSGALLKTGTDNTTSVISNGTLAAGTGLPTEFIINVEAARNLSISAMIANNGANGTVEINKIGTGNLLVSGPSSYTGNTTLSAGNVTLAGGHDRLGTVGRLIMSGGFLDLAGFNQTVGGLEGSSNIRLGTGYLKITGNATTLYSGTLSGSPSLSDVTWTGAQLIGVGSGGNVTTSDGSGVWTSQNSTTTNNLNEVAWTGNLAIAVGNSGTVRTSPDGITWASANSTTSQQLNAIVWTGTQAIAVGNTGNIITSPNGTTWTQRTSGISRNLFGITWTGSQAIAVGANRTVLTSPDGITWTERTTTPSGISLLDATWTGSLAIAVGASGNILTSPDGITWTARTSGTTTQFNRVLWSGSLAVAVGNSGIIHTSPDGITWNSASTIVGENLTSVVWTGTAFHAVGSNGYLLSSADGTTWENRSAGLELLASHGGDLSLAAAQTYRGPTRILGGTLRITSSNRINSASPLVLGPGGTFALDGFSETVASLSGTGGTVDLSVPGSTLTALGGTTTFAGNLTGNQTFNKQGAGTLTLSGNNSAFTGTLTLNDASTNVLRATASHSLGGPGSRVVINGRANLELLGNIVQTANIQLNPSGSTGSEPNALINVDGANTLTGNLATSGISLLSIQSGSLTVLGNVTGSGFRKIGNQSLTLGGNISASSILHEVGILSLVGATGSTTINATGGTSIHLSGNASVGGKQSVSGNGSDGLGAIRNLSGNNILGSQGNNPGVSVTGNALFRSDAGQLTLAGGNWDSGDYAINGVAAGANLTFDGAGNFYVRDAIGGNVSTIVKSGAGILTLSADYAGGFDDRSYSRFTGQVLINEGTVRARDLGSLGYIGNSSATNGAANGTVVAPGASLELAYRNTGAALFTPEHLTLSGIGVGGGGALRNTAGNNNGNNAWQGPVILAGNTTFTSETGKLAFLGTITGNANVLTLTGNGNFEFSNLNGTLSQSGNLILNGPGRLLVTSNNTGFSGATLVNGGAVRLRTANALGSTPLIQIASGTSLELDGSGVTYANYTVTLAGSGLGGNGTIRNISGNNTWVAPLPFSTAGTIRADSGNLTLTGAITAPGTLTFDGAGDLLPNGGFTLTSNGGLTKTGTGRLFLNSPNFYTGTTDLVAGIVRIAANNTLGSTVGINVGSGASLEVVGSAVAYNAIPISLTGNSAGSTLRFVTQGSVLRSPDASTWTPALPGTARTLSGLTWNGSRFIAVGTFGTIRTSIDGANWTSVDVGGNTALNSVVWTGNLAVTVGGSGQIRTSTDTANWTTRTSGTTTALASVSWNGSLAVAVGASGTLLTSGDGVAWTARNSTVTRNLNGITANASLCIAVGANGTVITSGDGINWTNRTSTSNTSSDLRAVTWVSAISGAVAVGSNGTILTSPDGINWTARSSGTSAQLNAVTANATRLTVVGSGGTVLTSPDGINWSFSNAGANASLNAAVWSGSQFLVVGGTGKTWSGPIVVSGNVTIQADTDELLSLDGNLTGGNASLVLNIGSSSTPVTFTGGLNLSAGNITKSGTGSLLLQSNNTFSGNLAVLGGSVSLTGPNGTASGAAQISVARTTSFTVDNSAGNNNDRLGAGTDLVLDGGTLTLRGNNTTESFDRIVVRAGASVIDFTGSTGTNTWNATGGLVRDSRGSMRITSQSLGSGNRILLGGQAEGLIGAWATVGGNFATYNATNGIQAFTAYNNVVLATANATDNVLRSVSDDSLLTNGTTNKTISSLRIADSTARTIDLGNAILTLTSGGLIYDTQSHLITATGNGALTAGAPGVGEILTIFLNAINNNQAILDVPIVNNGAGQVGMTKSGTSNLYLTRPSTYTGTTSITEGTLLILNPNLIPDASPFFLAEGATLDLRNFNETIGSLSGGGTIQLSQNPSQAGLAFGNSTFVLTGHQGALLTSPDAISWSVRSTGRLITLNGVTWNGTQFIAVGNTGNVTTSANGTVWTNRSTPTTAALRGVTWNGTQAIAVGDSGNVITSGDGVTWTNRTSGTNQSLTAVAATAGLAIAVGSNGTIITSPDGITWTNRTSGVSLGLNAVTWNGSFAVAVGTNSTITTSPDGTTWTPRTASTNQTLNAVAWTGSRFVAVGNSGNIITSDDGITWANATSNTTAALRAMVWTGSALIVAGESGSMFSSADGLAWVSGPGAGIYNTLAFGADNGNGTFDYAAAAIQNQNNNRHFGSLVKVGNGTQTFNVIGTGGNGYYGNVSVTNGTMVLDQTVPGVLDLQYNNGNPLGRGANSTTSISGGATLRLLNSAGGTISFSDSNGNGRRAFAFGADGGTLEIGAPLSSGNARSVGITTTASSSTPAVVTYASRPDTAWSIGNRDLIIGSAWGGNGSLSIVLRDGAQVTVNQTGSLVDGVLSYSGVPGGTPPTTDDETTTGRILLGGVSGSSYAAGQGIFLRDTLQITNTNGPQTFGTSITLLSGTGSNTTYVAFSPRNATASELLIGAAAANTLTIQNRAVARLDLQFRDNQSGSGSYLGLNSRTFIQAGGTLQFLRSNLGMVGSSIELYSDIYGFGDDTADGILDLGVNVTTTPFTADSVNLSSASNGGFNDSGVDLRVNGNGTGGLRITGNSIFVDALVAARFASVSGTGGYLSVTPTAALFAVPTASQWTDADVGLKILNHVSGTDADLGTNATWSRNLLVDDGAVLDATGDTLGNGNLTGLLLRGGTLLADSATDTAGLTLNGSLSTLASANTSVIQGNVSLGSADRVFSVANGTAAVDLLVTGSITGGAGLTKNGSGLLRLDASAAYTGATSIEEGTLRQNVADALPVATALTANATFDLNSFNATVGSLSGNGSGQVLLGTATLTLGDAGTPSTFNGTISGAGALIKTGAAFFRLTNPQTFTGGTILRNGTLALGSADPLNPTSNTLANAGNVTIEAGTLDLGNNDDTVAQVTLLDGTIDGSGNLIASGFDMQNGIVFARLGGNGALTKNSGGTVTLLAPASYAGNTTVNEGSLVIAGTNYLPAGGNITVNAGGTLNIASNPNTIGALLLNGGTVAGSANLTGTGFTLNAGTISANLAGNGSLTKLTPETADLLGNNTFSGNTTISAGTLRLSGSLTSPVTIQANGTLSGTGLASGAVTNSGTVAPGSPFGALSLGSTYTQTANGTLTIEIGGRPSDTNLWDRLVAAGSAFLNGTLNILYNAANAFTGVVGDTWKFLTAASRSGNFSSTNITATGLPANTELVVNYLTDGVELKLQASGVTYASWAAGITFPGGLSAPGDDPDKDGLPNLVEYGLDLDPTVPDAGHANAPVATVVNVSGTDYLAITFKRPVNAEERTDLTYTTERSGDLSGPSWSSGGVTLHSSNTVGDTETLVYRSTTALSAGNREFLRLYLEL
jgi:fibronectin-binding autotransporter adhesin